MLNKLVKNIIYVYWFLFWEYYYFIYMYIKIKINIKSFKILPMELSHNICAVDLGAWTMKLAALNNNHKF